MPQPVSTAAHGNAPLSAAGNPDAAARVAMVNHAAVNDEPRDVRAGKALLGGTVTIDRPRELLYSFWRDFNNLPRFMHNIEHVSSDGSVRSHWVVAAPAGQTLEWDAAMVEDRPGRLISWKSLDGASVRHSGRVEFRDSPDARGTVVTLTITYEPPGGSVGRLIAKLLHKEPNIQARQDLRRFKQLMETGEVSTAHPPYAAPRAI